MTEAGRIIIPNGERSIVLPTDAEGVVISSDDVVGLNVYEGEDGVDSIEAIKMVQAFRATGSRVGQIVILPNALTTELRIEIDIFNREVWAGKKLTDGDRARIEKAVRRRYRRAERHAKSQAAIRRGQAAVIARRAQQIAIHEENRGLKQREEAILRELRREQRQERAQRDVERRMATKEGTG